MADVFISYARGDRPLAEKLARTLQRMGRSVWWDESIPAGRRFADVIEKAIRAADCVVVLWSRESVDSRWVHNEAEAGANRKILVPVLVENVEIPFAFRSIQAADLTGWDGDPGDAAFERLVQDISAILAASPGRQPGSSSAAARRPVTKRIRQRWPSIAILVLVVLGLLWVLRQSAETVIHQRPIPSDSATGPRLAVLPFDFIAAAKDPEMESIGDGITLALIESLSKFLTVKSWWAVKPYRGTEKTPRVIAAELGVKYLLRGSVQEAERSWRIIPELSEAATSDVLWAEPFDKKFETGDRVDVQSRVAHEVAESIRGELSALLPSAFEELAERPADSGTDDSKAYRLYFRGWHSLAERTVASLEKSIDYFREATELDPAFARAWARLADAYCILSTMHGIRPPDWRSKAEQAARQAIALDDTLAEPHATLAVIFHYFDWDRKRAEEQFRSAIDLDPRYATAHQWYAELLVLSRRFDRGIAEVKRAVELDPDSEVIRSSLANMLYLAGRYDEAIDTSHAGIERAPGLWLHPLDLCQALSAVDRHDEAIAAGELAVDLGQGEVRALVALATVYGRAGRPEEAERLLEELQRKREAKIYVAPFQLAWIQASLGRDERALAQLEQGLEQRDGWTMLAPFIQDFAGNPVFREFLDRLEGVIEGASTDP